MRHKIIFLIILCSLFIFPGSNHIALGQSGRDPKTEQEILDRLSAINPDADQLLYELDHETGIEVPWPGGVRRLSSALTRCRIRLRASSGSSSWNSSR